MEPWAAVPGRGRRAQEGLVQGEGAVLSPLAGQPRPLQAQGSTGVLMGTLGGSCIEGLWG